MKTISYEPSYKNTGRRHSSAIIETTLGDKEKKNRISKKIKIHNTTRKDYPSGKLPDLKDICSFYENISSSISSNEDVEFTKRILEYNWFSMSDLSLLENDSEYSSNNCSKTLETDVRPRGYNYSKRRHKTLGNDICIYFQDGHSYCSIDLSELLSSKKEIYNVPENVTITEDMCYLDLNTLEFKPTNRTILPSNNEGVPISFNEKNNLLKVDHLGNVDVSSCLIDMHPCNLSPELNSFRFRKKSSLKKQKLSRSNSEYFYDSGNKSFYDDISPSATTTNTKNLQNHSFINLFEDFIKFKIIQKISGRKYSRSPPSKNIKTNLEKQNSIKKSICTIFNH